MKWSFQHWIVGYRHGAIFPVYPHNIADRRCAAVSGVKWRGHRTCANNVDPKVVTSADRRDDHLSKSIFVIEFDFSPELSVGEGGGGQGKVGWSGPIRDTATRRNGFLSKSLFLSLQPFDAYRYETIVRSRRARISFLASALHRIGDRGVGSSVAIAACVVARGREGKRGGSWSSITWELDRWCLKYLRTSSDPDKYLSQPMLPPIARCPASPLIILLEALTTWFETSFIKDCSVANHDVVSS